MSKDADLLRASQLAWHVAMSLALLTDSYDPEVLSEESREEWPPELMNKLTRQAAELSKVLKLKHVSRKLSLANPYPVEVAGEVAESYAECVAHIVDNLSRLSCPPDETDPKIDWDVYLHCAKEYERASGKPFGLMLDKPVGSMAMKLSNADRDAWILQQRQAGKTYKEIRNAIPQQNRNWGTLETDQGVFNAVKRLIERLNV